MPAARQAQAWGLVAVFVVVALLVLVLALAG
jgi:hypothetical protein